MGQLEVVVLSVLIHPIEPIGNPTAARFQKPNPETRVALQNSAKNETRCRGHLLEGMRVQMKKGIAVEAFRAAVGNRMPVLTCTRAGTLSCSASSQRGS